MIFTVHDIAGDIQERLPVKMPKKMIAMVCRMFLNRYMAVICKKKAAVTMRKCDVHTVYFEPDVKRLCNEFADLDETKEEGHKNSVLKDANKGIYTTLWKGRYLARVYTGRLGLRRVFAKKNTKRVPKKIR